MHTSGERMWMCVYYTLYIPIHTMNYGDLLSVCDE